MKNKSNSMNIEEEDIKADSSYFITCYHNMITNADDPLFVAHNAIKTKSIPKLAKKSLTTVNNIKAMTRCMLVRETYGYCWDSEQLAGYCCNIGYFSDFKNTKNQQAFLETHVDELAFAFNHSPSIHVQNICLKMLTRFSMLDGLIDKTIVLDKTRKAQFSKQIEFVDNTMPILDRVSLEEPWSFVGLTKQFVF